MSAAAQLGSAAPPASSRSSFGKGTRRGILALMDDCYRVCDEDGRLKVVLNLKKLGEALGRVVPERVLSVFRQR